MHKRSGKILTTKFGETYTAQQVAEFLRVDVKTIRKYYKKFGGMRLGRKYLFFEGSIENAIQKRTEMDGSSAEGREETGESISDQERSVNVGSQNKAKTRQRMEREDRHNLFE